MPVSDSSPSMANSPGLLKRLACLVYDIFLMIALWVVLYWPFYALVEDEQLRYLLFRGAFILAMFGYFARSWRVSGQTLGMQAWRIKLVSNDGQPVTYKQCLLRFLVAACSLLCLGIGYFWMLYDKDRLTWHDRYSGTRLIIQHKKKKSPAPE